MTLNIMSKRKIIDARAGEKGNISYVKIEGNEKFTSLETAIGMTKKDLIDLVVVSPKDAKEHLRTRPDKKAKNNLDEMAGDK